MSFISNPVFNEREKAYLEFVLSNDFPERAAVVEQLNHMCDADITRDVTPYYWVMEFRPNGINPGRGPMRPYIFIDVLHGPNTLPTAFVLHERNGVVFELEIFNAACSELDLDKIMCGDIVVSVGSEIGIPR